MMRAVWMYWSKPYIKHRPWAWLSNLHHHSLGVLSVEGVRQYCDSGELVTDNAGAEMLVEGVGLEFAKVSTALDNLSAVDPSMWTLGKLFSLREQQALFVNIDAACFLRAPLSGQSIPADVFARNRQPLSYDRSSYYGGNPIRDVIISRNSWLPEETLWFTSHPLPTLSRSGTLTDMRSPPDPRLTKRLPNESVSCHVDSA
jgi:hypothetical protein